MAASGMIFKLECTPIVPNEQRAGASDVQASAKVYVEPSPTASLLLPPTRIRLNAALELANALMHVMNMSMPCSSHYPAWLVLVRVLAVKLDLDFCISDPEALLPLAASFQELLSATAASILGFAPMPSIVMAQVCLPG